MSARSVSGRRVRRVELAVTVLALALTVAALVAAVIAGSVLASAAALSAAATALLCLMLVRRVRAESKLSPTSQEAALTVALRAITALEARAERLEKQIASSRSIARSSDEFPAWIELTRRVSLGTAVTDRTLDPHGLLVLLERAERLPQKSLVLLLSDDRLGSTAARAVLDVRPDLRPMILTSTDEGFALLQAELGDEPRVVVREGHPEQRDFGGIVGSWYSHDDTRGAEGVQLVLVAGPAYTHGAAARHAVAAGIASLSPKATLVVCRPGEAPMARALKLWPSTGPEGMTATAVSAWEVDVRSTTLG